MAYSRIVRSKKVQVRRKLPPELLLAFKTFLVLAIIGANGFFSAGFSGNAIAPVAQAASAHHHSPKKLRAVDHYKTHAVCATPGSHQAHCQLEGTFSSDGNPLTGQPATAAGYGPAQFHTAYNLPCTPGGAVASVCSAPGSFGPQTIAIVDAGDFATGTAGLNSSLQAYDQYYGIPACTLTNGCLNVVNQSGAASPLPPNQNAGWGDEIGLDVEVSHMICQTCKILLVEAANSSAANLGAANAAAATFNPVSISNSWGSPGADDPALDSDFSHPGIAEVAATGDSGTVSSSGAEWPSDNPNVVAASSTELQLNTDNTWASESVEGSSGGGCSNYYAAPSWQTSLSDWSLNGCGSYRSFGDVSADGDPDTGAAINIASTWYEFGGTSLSTPIIASIFALTGSVSSSVTPSEIPYLSFNSSNSHDITSGNDCLTIGQTNCTAAVGFDAPSGLGSPNGISGFELPSIGGGGGGGGGGPPFKFKDQLSFVRINDGSGHAEVVTYSGSSGYQQISGYQLAAYPAEPADGCVVPRFDSKGNLSFIRLNHSSGHVEVVTYSRSSGYQQIINYQLAAYPAVSDCTDIDPLFTPSSNGGSDNLNFIRLDHSSGHVEIVTYSGSSGYQQLTDYELSAYPAVPSDGEVIPQFHDGDKLTFIRLNDPSGQAQMVTYTKESGYKQLLGITLSNYPAVSDYTNVVPLYHDANGIGLDDLSFVRLNNGSNNVQNVTYSALSGNVDPENIGLTGYPSITDPDAVTAQFYP